MTGTCQVVSQVRVVGSMRKLRGRSDARDRLPGWLRPVAQRGLERQRNASGLLLSRFVRWLASLSSGLQPSCLFALTLSCLLIELSPASEPDARSRLAVERPSVGWAARSRSIDSVPAWESSAAVRRSGAWRKAPIRPLRELAQVRRVDRPDGVQRVVPSPDGLQVTTSGRRGRVLESWQRVIWLQDYNTRVVVLGTTLLGFAAGMIGSFTLLRRRALLGDALSHATLPGIAVAFIVATWAGVSEKSLLVLLLGAACSGMLGMGLILLIRGTTRLKEDAALGIVLSVFFGAGIALLGLVQQMKTGHAAGLEAFIYGKTASLVASDAWLIGISGLACSALSLLLFKELALLCFDAPFAGSKGFPTLLLDGLLMGLVVVVTIIGLQAVGLVLMIALLVIPAAAARFWTQRMQPMTWVAALLGAASCWLGAATSALLPRLPSGAMIVLASTGFFVISLFFGPQRGLLGRWRRRIVLQRRVDRQHLLRALYELYESRELEVASDQAVSAPIRFSDLLAMRSWSAQRLRKQIELAARQELVVSRGEHGIALTSAGFLEASHLVHNHRLWELYLITHADVAPGKVDRDADRIEHVLDPDLIAQLEELLEQRRTAATVARSPHPISHSAAASTTSMQKPAP